MKQSTVVIFFKAASVTIIGAAAPMAASLSQWVNSGDWPPRIAIVGVVIPAMLIGGCSALSAFLSSSWANYTANGNKPL